MIVQADCLDFLPTLDAGSVDLIYADPPFCSGRDYAGAAGAFSDRWPSMQDYLDWMSDRLEAMHLVLAPTGSIYLHCDQSASHRIRCLLDDMFGVGNFRNEIVWCYRRWTAGDRNFQRMHDTIFRYTKTDKFFFNAPREPYGDWIKKDYRNVDADGRRWRWHTVKGKRCKVYLEDESRGVKMNDVWAIPHLGSTAKERVGYPTQKPIALIDRIVKASSNEGDLVLDPFCGSGTTLVAAKQLGRRFIGCDISADAVAVASARVDGELL